MSSTLVASPSPVRASHLGSPKFRGSFASSPSSRYCSVPRTSRLSNSSTSTTSTATKRRCPADEDAASRHTTTYASPTKRVKSGLCSATDNTLPKLKPKAQPQHEHQPPQRAAARKRAFGADLTNTSRASLATKRVGKPASGGTQPRTVLKAVLAPKKSGAPGPGVIAKRSASPSRTRARARARSPRLGSARGTKRALSPPAYRRVDPPRRAGSPSSRVSSFASTSIDSLLSRASSSSASSLSSTPSASDARAAAPTAPVAPALVAPVVKESWLFDIYEDTPDELLQNIMEHSTTTLDISDTSDNEAADELKERGKENIPPARLAELLATRPEERRAAMRLDDAADVRREIPQRRGYARGYKGGKVLGEHREVLREMSREELELEDEAPEVQEEEEAGKKGKAAANTNAKMLPPKSTFEFSFGKPEAQPESSSSPVEVTVTPASPGSPGWVIWESDHEGEKDAADGDAADDEEDDEEDEEPTLPMLPPLPTWKTADEDDDEDYEYFEMARHMPLPSSPGESSDKEN